MKWLHRPSRGRHKAGSPSQVAAPEPSTAIIRRQQQLVAPFSHEQTLPGPEPISHTSSPPDKTKSILPSSVSASTPIPTDQLEPILPASVSASTSLPTRNKILQTSSIVKHKQRIARSSTSTWPIHWTVTRSANALFVGRDDILQELEASIRNAIKDSSRQDQCRFVISGIGGQGKSEICIQLAQRVRQLFWGVFWVDVSTPSLAETGFLNIANRLNISAKTLDDARQGLANLQHTWLLILDNADDPDIDYSAYLPPGVLGIVIMTSRNAKCSYYATARHIALERLAGVDTKELLLRAAQIPSDKYQLFTDDAEVVGSLLHSHPLALIQAGSYISNGHCTLAEYPQIYEKQRKRLLTFKPSQAQSRYKDVYATFEASAEVLQLLKTEAAEDALQLLPLLAMWGPSRVPLALFETAWLESKKLTPQVTVICVSLHLTPWHVSRLPALIQADTDSWDSFRLIEAIQLLKAFSLVSTDTKSKSLYVSMHPLIHAWSRDRLDANQLHEAWIMAGALTAISSDNREFWLQNIRQLHAHLQILMSVEMSTAFASHPPSVITPVLLRCALAMKRMGDEANLSAWMEKLFNHLDLDRTIVDFSCWPLYDIFARSLADYGKFEQAESILEQIVKSLEKTLTKDHHDRLTLQLALAAVYLASERPKEAILLQEQVVKIHEETLSDDDPFRLVSQHELARAYLSNKQPQKAVLILEEVCKVTRRIQPEYHPDSVASELILALSYRDLDRRQEALKMMENVVKIRRHTLDEHHPSLLNAENWLEILREEMAILKSREAINGEKQSFDSRVKSGRSDFVKWFWTRFIGI